MMMNPERQERLGYTEQPELATPVDINVMESFALGLTQEYVHHEFIKQCVFEVPATSASIIMRMHGYANDSASNTILLELGRQAFDQAELNLQLDQNNRFVSKSYDTVGSLNEASMIAQELLDSGQLDASTQAVVRYMQNLALCLLLDIPEDNTGRLIGETKYNFPYVTDVAQGIIDEKAPGTEYICSYEYPMDNKDVLHVMVNQYEGFDNFEIAPDSPSLQIVYNDKQNRRLCVFKKFYDDSCEFKVSDNKYDPADYTGADDRSEQQVSTNPAKQDILKLIDALVEAHIFEILNLQTPQN